jgi:hypothetical protein
MYVCVYSIGTDRNGYVCSVALVCTANRRNSLHLVGSTVKMELVEELWMKVKQICHNTDKTGIVQV